MEITKIWIDHQEKINFSSGVDLATSDQAILASNGRFTLGKQKYAVGEIPLAPIYFLKDGVFVLDHNFQLQKVLPTDDWGEHQNNKYQELSEEIKCDDCELLLEKGVIIRIVRVSRITVLCFGNRLVETKQILKDGRVRYRGFKSVSEKVKLGESFFNGALRGIKEELGLNANNLVYQSVSVQDKAGSSYPNLMCRYTFFDYTWEMPVELFNPLGYIADECGVKTFFQWEPLA